MSSSEKAIYEDSVLIKYLIGALPESDAERLDELSVSDNDFAIRLEAIENDLVDSWARGDLSGETLEQFDRTYLSSPERLSKLRFAQALVARQGRIETKGAALKTSTAAPPTRAARPDSGRTQLRPLLGWLPKWAPAAITAIEIVVFAYLATVNLRLRRELAQERAQRQTIEAKDQQLSRALAALIAADAVTKNDSEQTSSAPSHSAEEPKLVSVLLLPEMRGSTELATVSLPAKTARLVLRLQLEADDFPAYHAVLKESGSGKVAWRSQSLKASSEKGKPIVAAGIPASLLKSQNYLVQLAGVRPPQEEIIGTYPFRITLE